jgi:hypothetical protein
LHPPDTKRLLPLICRLQFDRFGRSRGDLPTSKDRRNGGVLD